MNWKQAGKYFLVSDKDYKICKTFVYGEAKYTAWGPAVNDAKTEGYGIREILGCDADVERMKQVCETHAG